MKRYFTLLILLAFSSSIYSQKLVDVQFQFSLTSEGVSSLIGGMNVAYGVDLYKVTYMTPDVNGNDHVASGLMCIPNDPSTAFPLACYQHGTVGGRDDVPSNLQGGFLLPLVFSSFGYVVCAADFIGLGDSPGVHPYVHADTEASAAIDMLRAARELDEDDTFDGLTLNDQVFITGYSQGGHAAMAAHREIETNLSSEFTVTASAPMSGPYSISESMVDFTLGDDEYGTVAYLAWLTLGYKVAYPELLEDFEIEDMFKPQYVADILEFRDENITLWELNDRMIDTLNVYVGATIPKEMLNQNILNSLLSDPTHPLSMALADNDVYDWTPTAPTTMYYCEGDDQVTFENAILAENVMKENGALEVTSIRLDNDMDLLDHGGCVFPAATGALFFFGAYQELSTSVSELSFDEDVKIRNNDVVMYIDIPFERQEDQNILKIFDQTGRLMVSHAIAKGKSQIDIAQLHSGMYLVTLNDKTTLYKSQKFIKI